MTHQSADPFFRVLVSVFLKFFFSFLSCRLFDCVSLLVLVVSLFIRFRPFVGGGDTIEDNSLNPYLKASDVEEEEDDDAAGSYVKMRPNSTAEVPECSSVAGSGSVADECASLSSDNRRNPPSSALRRLSQDRSSAPRIQSTRLVF
ncbi:hypothetical protein OESDEN_15875 [Oesophagostomum dentatum]|uniref:Uncharacterized protein n=1 Tax=Oesophagostomum dentatum TaxID=61180 RepID=A0A0B1SKI9_OESDE|nr:hypothetical protein OESDEN_15875 [Oesophagostomum dentatum]